MNTEGIHQGKAVCIRCGRWSWAVGAMPCNCNITQIVKRTTPSHPQCSCGALAHHVRFTAEGEVLCDWCNNDPIATWTAIGDLSTEEEEPESGGIEDWTPVITDTMASLVGNTVDISLGKPRRTVTGRPVVIPNAFSGLTDWDHAHLVFGLEDDDGLIRHVFAIEEIVGFSLHFSEEGNLQAVIILE